jgi:hypothetical protein
MEEFCEKESREMANKNSYFNPKKREVKNHFGYAWKCNDWP